MGRGERSGDTERKVTQREKVEKELRGLKRHVELLLVKSQSHQTMCSLCRPPSQLLFSLLYCFHSHDTADCTASTIQCLQTKSIYWDRDGAPETPELCPPLREGVRGVGLLARATELCVSPGAPWQNPKAFRPKAFLKSDKAQL